MFRLTAPLLTAALVLSTSSSAAAQWGGLGQLGPLINGLPAGGAPTQVFSANPVGLMVEFYNFEYEVRITDTVSVGAGASRLGWRPFSSDLEPRLNGDAFVRFYPGGSAFNGIALGLKAGPTRLPGEGTFWGVGFDMNASRAVTDHLVISSGFGLKRLFRPSAEGTFLVPTWRLLNVGVGF